MSSKTLALFFIQYEFPIPTVYTFSTNPLILSFTNKVILFSSFGSSEFIITKEYTFLISPLLPIANIEFCFVILANFISFPYIYPFSIIPKLFSIQDALYSVNKVSFIFTINPFIVP